MTTLRLLWIHLFAWISVWLLSYWPGWEYLAAVLYLVVLSREAGTLRGVAWGKRLSAALLWQFPGWIMMLALLTGWNPCGICDYAIFGLIFWTTPVLPWLVLLPVGNLACPWHYYGMMAAVPLLGLWIWIFSGKINPPAVFKHSRFGSAKDCA